MRKPAYPRCGFDLDSLGGTNRTANSAGECFASKTEDRFADARLSPRDFGPAIEDAVAWIDCEIEVEHEAGDHLIVLARAVALEASRETVEPLVFFRGTYSPLGRPQNG
ncbi:MAG: flavin reductase family protein [Actinobacteria bacterium]|nr:flavin reductase family protein [Actinomycetota bacterium]